MLIPERNPDHIHKSTGIYSTKRLLETIQEKKIPVSTIKVKDLEWMKVVDLPNLASSADRDLANPIVVYKDGDKEVVFDGFHRLVKAMETGVEELPCYRVDNDVLVLARMTLKEYHDSLFPPPHVPV